MITGSTIWILSLGAACLLLAVLVALDLARKIRIIHPIFLACYLPVAANAPAVAYVIDRGSGGASLWALPILAVLVGYCWLRLNAFPVRDGVTVGFRVKALGGANPLLVAYGYTLIVQLVVVPVSFLSGAITLPRWLLITNAVYSAGCLLVLYLNGLIRAFATSKSLSILDRVVAAAWLWLPVIGAVLWIRGGRLVRREYLAAVDRVAWEETLVRDDRCATRHPILLLHGVGFRDRDHFNYWGRIPRYLKRHGAQVFYGGQQAFGTIEQNGEHVATRIREVLELTGADQVNLIAHSKGGLDARAAISRFGMGSTVASLTTMNTPHHGVRFTDTATKMKESFYLRMAAIFNFLFGKLGDDTPDFLTATMAFRTDLSREFNEKTPDVRGVHYQSYTSVMSAPGSYRLLATPYRIIKALGEENDGLVSVDSARWGEFRGVFRSTAKRGISHGDMIDLRREDYHGFNVLAAYLEIVGDLKARGY